MVSFNAILLGYTSALLASASLSAAEPIHRPGHSTTSTGHKLRRLEHNHNKEMERVEDHFWRSMEMNVNSLPKSGAASKTPWVGHDWPAHHDGINHRWQAANELSPSEKYAAAFGLDATELQTKVSKKNGVLAHDKMKACEHDYQCFIPGQERKCALRRGETKGKCVYTWYSNGHGWAAASISEQQPKCPVTKNGVRFEPNDIKALISNAYDDTWIEAINLGKRFNGDDEEPPATSMDEFDRYKDEARRDVNPAILHLTLGNVLGMQKQSFIMDVNAKSPVFYQPVRSYEILESSTMSPLMAGLRYFQYFKYPFNDDATSIMRVKTRVSWIVEDTDLTGEVDADKAMAWDEYEYLLELDAHNDILGGEWIGDSKEFHPDFLRLIAKGPSSDGELTRSGFSYPEIKALVDASANGNC